MKRKISYLPFLMIIMSLFNKADFAQPALQTPANNSTGYTFTKVTYNWNAVDSATSYDLVVCDDTASTASYKKTYSGIKDNSYQSAADYLDFGTQYYWKVRAKVGATYTDYSNYFTFTTGTPSNSIGTDVNASITFDHTTGTITQIIYKKGSGNPLLDTTQNAKNKLGLGRINNETGTKVASWSEALGNYIYNYENSAYGSKTIAITWSVNGIKVDMNINLAAGKAATLNAVWQPGGDKGPLHDHILYASNASLLNKTNLTYPGVSSVLYSGNTIFSAMVDDRYNEYVGFKSSTPIQTTIQQGLAFGPAFTYSSSTSPQTLTLSFAVMNKTNYFSWTPYRYILVYAPTEGTNLLDQSSPTIKWETFDVYTKLNINLSTDGGSTFNAIMASNITDNGSYVVTLPNFSAKVPLNNCIVRVSAGTLESGYSGIFSIVSNKSSVFSVPVNLTGAPTDTVMIPVLVSPGAGDSIYTFDIRLFYNKDNLTYSKSIADSSLTNWSLDVTNNTTNGYLQIGGYNNGGNAITLSDTLVKLKFYIKPTSRVGIQSALTINNSYLSAANSVAKSLPVTAIDGMLTLYTRASGFLRYIVSKKPITGAKMIAFIDTVARDTAFGSTNSGGYFDFSNQTPGSVIKLMPIRDLSLPASINDAVSATDALKAFGGRDGGPAPLTPLQNIVADINGDGKLNSTDAYAILKISTGELTAADFGQSNWVFVDSNYSITNANWASAPQNKIYQPLDSVKTTQSFWGAIRGNVSGNYGLPASLNKSSAVTNGLQDVASTVEFSVPVNLNALPGDTIALPLNVKLNGKTIGAFNASIQLNNNLLTYAGVFVPGSSMPSNKGWMISTNFTSGGKFNIGAADFSDVMSPISNDGSVAVFKFVVSNQAKTGDTSQIALSGFSVSDSKLNNLSVTGINGKITVASVSSTKNDKLHYEYNLSQNYPNPFNPSTTIEYSIKKQSNVEVEIYNAIGQRISVLVNGIQEAGNYKLNWNAKNFASGIYFYRIRAGEFTQIKKMILLK
jgi:hypothetical protein